MRLDFKNLYNQNSSYPTAPRAKQMEIFGVCILVTTIYQSYRLLMNESVMMTAILAVMLALSSRISGINSRENWIRAGVFQISNKRFRFRQVPFYWLSMFSLMAFLSLVNWLQLRLLWDW